MKIGVGITFYNRPLHREYWSHVWHSFVGPDVVYVTAIDTDKDRKGIAARKNECLKKLYEAGCEYIFLFDEDCFPVRKNWAEYFIEASKQTGLEHFQLQVASNATKVTQVAQDDEIENPIQVEFFDNSNGCFLFMTKRCIEKVGGFNEAYGTYGHEHADYSKRIHQAGLTKFGAHCTPKDARKYIYSLDLEPESELHRKLKHKGSMPSKEALTHIQKSAKVFQQPSPIYIPL